MKKIKKEILSEKRIRAAVDYMMKRLHRILSKNLQKGNYENALEAYATCVEIFCSWNQHYADEYLQKCLHSIQKKLLNTSLKKEETDAKTILFYDGFAQDARGLMLIYMKALMALDYRIIYVSSSQARGKQPTLAKVSEGKNIVWEYLSFPQKYVSLIQELNGLFVKYRPAKAFLYMIPSDIVGPVVFDHYEGSVERFLINMADHACSGIYSVDYCLEFRDYGANVSRLYKGIAKEKLIKIPYYPYIDDSLPFEGFPFEKKAGQKVVFSGGALYKTFDEENTYYRLVKSILEYDDEVVFVYAGEGDDSELKKLINDFSERVWHIPERGDLYQLLKYSYLYINTYPIGGGQMIQYAALAGKVPVTIYFGQELDDIIPNRKDCRYIFGNMEEALQEIYKLLDNEEYARQKGQTLMRRVMGEKEFEYAVKMAVLEHAKVYEIQEQNVSVEDVIKHHLDTFRFKDLQRIIIKDEHWELRKYFPMLFLRKRMRNLGNLLFCRNTYDTI